MRYDADGAKSLDLLQARAAYKLAEIHRLLAPGLVAPFSYEELQRMAEGRMADMTPDERETFRRKAIVAYAELEQLMGELSRNLAAIGDELHKVDQHSRGATAYAQAPRGPSHPPFGL